MAVLLHRTPGVDQRRVAVPGGTPRHGTRLVLDGAEVSARPARPAGRHRYRAPGGRAVLVRRRPEPAHCRIRPSAHPVVSLVGIAALACLAVVGLGLVGALSAPSPAPSGPAAGVSASFRP
ncbi:hypothetical protein [Gandjariella thermophila]|uniref:Uncharacterized protein n=1 Tax=Gandjariella thermophila TaxID=1931992 RepID=A0A4D4J4C3_9PSEU|nr:hypothetical protein [Gandjariella thermophila]GDY30314.1 hypothetical protein GTS_19470 [Gandjariella thermophila]